MGKYLRKNKTKMNIPIRVAAALLCLTLVSTYFVSGLFARYVTRGESTSSARVAKFSIEGSGILSQPIAINLAPGGSDEKKLFIQNNSEVAVEYTVTVTNMTNNLPLNLSMEKEGTPSAEQKNDTTFTAQWLPGSYTDTYTLHIEWSDEKADEDLALIGMVDHIVATVTAVQID